jgi:Tol biopolymer transport system component
MLIRPAEATGVLLLILLVLACGSPSASDYNKKGVDLADDGRWEDAIAEFNKAIEKDAGFAASYGERGRANLALNFLEAAIADFQKATDLDANLKEVLAPALAESYIKQGDASLDRRDLDGAVAVYEKALETGAAPESLKLNLADLYKSRGDANRLTEDYLNAVGEYERAAALDPAHAAVLTPTGRITFMAQASGATQRINRIAPDGSGLAYVIDGSQSDWTADGARIAYLRGNIFIMNADGSGSYNLTNSATTIPSYPDWSPDGTKIVFSSYSRGGDFLGNELYVINADGSGLRQITKNQSADIFPDWSPDGSRIVFEINGPSGGIYVINADGSGQAQLGGGGCPSWSPGGSKIAFSRGGIWIMNATGGGATQVVNIPGAISICPVWSPDGLHLAFSSTRSSENLHEVYIVRIDGKNLTKVTNLPTSDFVSQWQP